MSQQAFSEETMSSNGNCGATPLLLTASEAAAMFKASERTWRTWDTMGRIPKPIRIGRKVFWRPEDLKAWVAAGCPDRASWEVMRT